MSPNSIDSLKSLSSDREGNDQGRSAAQGLPAKCVISCYYLGEYDTTENVQTHATYVQIQKFLQEILTQIKPSKRRILLNLEFEACL